MQIIKNKETFSNICFYIGLCIHALVMIIGYSDFTIPYVGRLLQMAFAFLCLKIVTTYYTKKEWILLILVSAVGFFSYIFTADEYVISVIVLIFAAKKTDTCKIFKTVVWFAVLGTFITAALSLCGIGGIPVDIRDYGRGGIEARWCLGFGHANNLHGTLWYIVILLLFIYYETLTWKHFLVFSVINIGLYFFTISKAGIIATQLAIIGIALYKYFPQLNRKKWIYWCSGFSVILIQSISVISAAVPIEQSKVLWLLDKIFTGRIQFAYKYAPLTDWRLFSRGGEIGVVDNGWVVMYYNYGVFVGVLFVALHCYLLYMAYKRKSGTFLVMILTSVLYTFMEASYCVNATYLLSNITYVVAMLMMGEWNYEST